MVASSTLTKYLVATLCWVPLAWGVATAKPTLHHDLSIRLDPAAHLLKAVDRIDVSQVGSDHLVFSMAKHLKILGVALDGSATPFRFRRGRLYISLQPKQTQGRILIEYEGRFNDRVDVQPLNTDNPGYGVTGTIQSQGTLLLAGAGWYPENAGAASSYTLTVDAPQGVLAVTTGTVLGHTTVNARTVSRWEVSNPLEGLSLVAGPFRQTTKTFGALTAITYFSEDLQNLSPQYLDATGRYLKFYEARFGPYPFEQFAVVENFFPTGYGFPSFTLIGRRVLALPFIIHTSLGHEIAHCWWGNGVLVDASLGNWSEGLTAYVADYLYKEQQGEGLAHRRQWLRNYARLVGNQKDMAVSEFLSRTDPHSKTVGYDKAAMVFHMLRQRVGEAPFWQTLRDVYARHRFQAISWRHWQRAFEQTAGASLERFFQQWVYATGAPLLTLSGVAVDSAGNGYSVSGRVEQSTPYYDLDIDLVLETETDVKQMHLSLSAAATPFRFKVDQPPRKLTVDPQVHIFRRLSQQELPPTVNAVKGAASATVVVSAVLNDDWLKIAQRLATAMGLDNATIGREKQFSEAHLANSDLIWIGEPRGRRHWPKAMAGFKLDQQHIVVAEQTYPRKEINFFGVFLHPQRTDRTVAIFLPASVELAARLCRKIPHYGKYSYLVFKGAQNQAKGVWPVADSPLMVQWPGNASSHSNRGAP